MAIWDVLPEVSGIDPAILATRVRIVSAQFLAKWGALHVEMAHDLSPSVVSNFPTDQVDAAERLVDIGLAPAAWMIKKYGDCCISIAMRMVNSTKPAPQLEHIAE